MKSPTLHLEVYRRKNRGAWAYRFRRCGKILNHDYNTKAGAKRALRKLIAAILTMERGWQKRIEIV